MATNKVPVTLATRTQVNGSPCKQTLLSLQNLFVTSPLTVAGVGMNMDFVLERAGGGTFVTAKKVAHVQEGRGLDHGRLQVGDWDVGRQQVAGDMCRPRRHRLGVHVGPRVCGGYVVEEEPCAQGNLDKDTPYIKTYIIVNLYPDSVLINNVLSIYNLNVKINGIFLLSSDI